MYIQYCMRDGESNVAGDPSEIAVEPIEFLGRVYPGKLPLIFDYGVHVVAIQGCGIGWIMREMLNSARCWTQCVQAAMGGDPKNMAIVFLNARNFH